MVWTNSYYHFDAIGNTRGVTDDDQGFKASYQYTAFGEQLIDSSVANPFRFIGQTGYYFDTETTLVQVRHRSYSPSLTRWLSEDRIKDGKNIFTYSANNPLDMSDPSGLTPTRKDAKKIEQIVAEIELFEDRNKDSAPLEILKKYQNAMCWPAFGRAQVAIDLDVINKNPPSGFERWAQWSYIYTSRKEWIDLGHFFTSARAAAIYGNPKFVKLAGLMYEHESQAKGKLHPELPGVGSSAFTPEDLTSNDLGAEFGSKLKADIKLSKQFETFIRDLQPKDPVDAWNYLLLPRDEVEWELAWRNNPQRAMKKAEIVLNPKHPYWTQHPPSSNEVIDRALNDEVWGPLTKPNNQKMNKAP